MKTLRHPRESTAVNDLYVGQSGQITVDTDRWEIRLHDGVTPGGHRILNLNQLLALFLSRESEFGEVAFDPDGLGFLTRIGHKQWTLRQLEPGDGITIEEPDGFNDNPVIAVDEEWLAEQFPNNIPTRLRWLGGIGGDLDENDRADLLTLDGENAEGWTGESNGMCGFVRFDVSPNDGAALKVHDFTARPIVTQDGNTDLSTVIKAGNYALLVRIANQFVLMGYGHPQQDWIYPIDGLVADNVQDALEELRALITAIPAQPDSPIKCYKYGPIADEWDPPVMKTQITQDDLPAMAENDSVLFLVGVQYKDAPDSNVEYYGYTFTVTKYQGKFWTSAGGGAAYEGVPPSFPSYNGNSWVPPVYGIDRGTSFSYTRADFGERGIPNNFYNTMWVSRTGLAEKLL